MKKLLSVLLSVMLVGSVFSLAAGAAPAESSQANRKIISETVEYYPDGTSAVITVAEEISSVTTRAATYSKTGYKTYTARNESGGVLWKFTVHGTFKIDPGVSATCSSASYSTSDLASGWSLKSGSATRSGDDAIGDGTFQHKTLFVVTQTKSCHVVLHCDVNGNFS